MATDVERLIVTLEASTKQYERALAKAQGTTVTAMRKIERDMAASTARQQAILGRAGAGIESTLRRSLVGPMAALGAALGGRQIIGFADSFTRIENALKITGLAGDDLTGTMERLFAIASKHGAPVEALGELYGRVALAQKELNVSSEEMIKFTDNVGAALRVSGRSAEQSRGALLQLSQAIGSGIVRGEEFNAVLEGALPIAQAAARGLDEAGGSVAKLRTLIIDGKVSSQAFFQAFMAGGANLQAQALLADKTVGQAMENIKTAFIEAVGTTDNLTGASQALGTALGEVARQVGFIVQNIKEFQDFGSGVVGFFSAIDANLREFGRDIGLADALGSELADARATLAEYLRRQDEAVADGNEALARHYDDLARVMFAKISVLDPGPAFEQLGRQGGAAFNKGLQDTISLKDAPVGGGVGGAGGADKEQAAVDKLIDSLREELDVIRALDPVNARMAALRGTLATAADHEAARIRVLISIIEKEGKAREGQETAATLIENMRDEIAILRATDPVMKRMLELRHDLAGATAEQREEIERLITAQERLNRVAELGPVDQRTGLPIGGGGIDQRTGLTKADIAGGVETGVGGMHKGVVGAIGQQTSTLSRTFGDVARHLTEGISSAISGPGTGESFTSTAASPNKVASFFEDELVAGLEKQIDARQAEISVLQTGLQYKNLTTEQTKEAQLQIAKLTLEIEQFGQGIVTASQGIAQGTGFFADQTTLFGNQLSVALAKAKQAGAALGSSLTAAEAARLSKINSFGGFAEGGHVRGPGGPTSDRVPIWASAGEFVVNAKQARKYRELLEAINSGSARLMVDGGLVARANASAQRLASGGVVQAAAVGPRWSGDINLGGVNILAPEGRVSQASARDAGRQVAREVLGSLREMGVL